MFALSYLILVLLGKINIIIKKLTLNVFISNNIINLQKYLIFLANLISTLLLKIKNK